MPGSGALTPALARRIFAYNRRVFDRYVRRIRRMPWRAVRRRRGIGHESLFDTLVHILQVHEVWIGYILPGRNSDPELEALFRDPVRHPNDWRAFAIYQRRVWTMIDAQLQMLSTRELGRSVHAFWMPGRYTVSDGLMQTTFEQAHHVGEIIGALWQEDVEPPEMTWIRIGDGSPRRAIRP